MSAITHSIPDQVPITARLPGNIYINNHKAIVLREIFGRHGSGIPGVGSLCQDLEISLCQEGRSFPGIELSKEKIQAIGALFARAIQNQFAEAHTIQVSLWRTRIDGGECPREIHEEFKTLVLNPLFGQSVDDIDFRPDLCNHSITLKNKTFSSFLLKTLETLTKIKDLSYELSELNKSEQQSYFLNEIGKISSNEEIVNPLFALRGSLHFETQLNACLARLKSRYLQILRVYFNPLSPREITGLASVESIVRSDGGLCRCNESNDDLMSGYDASSEGERSSSIDDCDIEGYGQFADCESV